MQSTPSPLLGHMAAANEFIKRTQGMNPQQVQQQAVHAATTQQLSFGEALAIKQMHDDIKPPAPPPQPGTVMTDMIHELNHPGQPAQQPMPPGPYAQQAQQPPQQGQPPQDPRMAAGLGTLPAPNIGQHVAGGGIVAFADGGSTDEYKPPSYWEAIKERLAILAGTHHVGTGIADKGARTVETRKDYIDRMVNKNSMARGGLASFADGGMPDQPPSPYRTATPMDIASRTMNFVSEVPGNVVNFAKNTVGSAYDVVSKYTPHIVVPNTPQVNQAVTAGPVAGSIPPPPPQDDQPEQQVDVDRLTGYDPSQKPPDYAAGFGIKVGASGLPKELQASMDFFKEQANQPVRSLAEDTAEWKSAMETLGIGKATKEAIGHLDQLDAAALKNRDYERSKANLDGSIAAMKQATILGGQEGYAGNGLGGNIAVLGKFLEARRGTMQRAEQNYMATKEKLIEGRDKLAIAAENNDREAMKSIISDRKADLRDHRTAVRDYASVWAAAARATMQEQAASLRAAAAIRSAKEGDELRPLMLQSASRLSWLANHKPTDPHYDEVLASSAALSKAIQEGRGNQPAGYGVNQRNESAELRDFNKDGSEPRRLLNIINDDKVDKVKRADATKKYRALARASGIDSSHALDESDVIDATDLPRAR